MQGNIARLLINAPIIIGNSALELVRKFDVCFFEDLNLQGMKRLWGRKVSDLSFGEFMLKMRVASTKASKAR